MKRKLLWLMALLLLAAAGAVVWIRLFYLKPDQLLKTLQARLEASLGRHVEMDSANLVGVDQLHVQGLRIADPSPNASKNLLEAKSATVTWKWIGALVGRASSFRASLEEPALHLAHDRILGWNFDLPERESAHAKVGLASPEDQERKKAKPKTGMNLEAQAEESTILLDHEEWGRWELQFPEIVRLDLQRKASGTEGSLSVSGSAQLKAGSVPAPIHGLSPFVQNLFETFNPSGASLGFSIEANWGAGKLEIVSKGPTGLKYSGPDHEVSIDRFRLATSRIEAQGISIDSAALDLAQVKLSSWNNPVISHLRIPWTGPPQGPLQFQCHDLLYRDGKLDLRVSGAQIEAVTFAARDLPWLKILSRRELWGLAKVGLEGHLTFSPQLNQCDWSGAKILFASGELGQIESKGFFRGGPQSEWVVTAVVDRCPIPAQEIEGKVFEPGVLSGEMTWGEEKASAGGIPLIGKGKIILHNGEIGAVRMLGRIDEVLNVEAIAHSRFETLSFNFEHSQNHLKVSELELKSNLLNLTGAGSYGSNHEINVQVTAKPSAELAASMRTKPAATIVGAFANAENLTIRITGELDQPVYEIVPGEGVSIPIQELIQGLGKKK
jgi:hypothetical protein